MKLDIHERDIGSKLCQMCAACCRITFNLQDTTSRYRQFLRQIGYNLLPPPVQEQTDCCDKKHDAKVDMGYCMHLEIEERPDGNVYRCHIYGTSEYPDLCEQFNCVSWAKANDTYSERNSLLASAQQALDKLQSGRA